MFNLEQARRPVALRELRKLRRQTDLYTLTDISVSFLQHECRAGRRQKGYPIKNSL